MIECLQCKGNNFIKSFCHATERFVYDDCWDCLSEEMYEAEIQEKIKILISKDENVTDFTRDLARLLISEPLIYEEIWKYLRD
ncbi:MAG: hypothetical protein GOVbin4206_25 [Prokaryotic dsDNA virus sp.]|nr:MAG: hypothetical protein GOVbin4206_25 [Prokaryotic dsDNA virus sp.]|tara:strand:+ start:4002 stop:4250 length:249 start_codon:yes stop_codon:yes gene_type:complete